MFPVNTFSYRKNLSFKIKDQIVYSLNIRLDNYNPDFHAYIDVSRYKGQTLEIGVNPEIKITYRETDEIDTPGLYKEPMRPQIHFTTKNGWINDPNGLIYIDGVYHMFYQYNPAEPEWENMHWGHAESHDMIHWVEKPAALFPDSRGTMFSGSAVYDEKNLINKDSDKKAALLYYTTTSPFCQYMSYSTDNFKTIKTYGDKPVVPFMVDGNRDPKVIFCEEINSYIMALYLTDDTYCILKSDNLTDWDELQKIHLKDDNECPDIFPLYTDSGEKKWVFMGAHDKYLIGSFKEGFFKAEQSEISLHYGSAGSVAPVSITKNKTDITIIVDYCSIEISSLESIW